MAIADLRRDYQRGTLDRGDLAQDPLEQFHRWFRDAQVSSSPGGRLRKIAIGFYKWIQIILGSNPVEPNSMILATVDKDGCPSARTVLLKGADERGFVFYTNYESRKGRELAQNPKAALVFYWSELERQVCIAGTVEKLPREESETYFKSRPRGSRVGAWASKQSSTIRDRAELEKRFHEIESRFGSGDIPLPEFWGGYVLRPERIEYWQGRASRLHDRFCYVRQPDGSWKIGRLSP
jgi:pyridoxamine 5'-phosphate oxidase